jgi:hypothetical protein
VGENFSMKAGAEIGFKKEEKITITDYRNFPRFTNKVETFGVVNKRKLIVICDGEGHMRFIDPTSKSQKYQDLIDALEKLKKVHDDGIIEHTDYEEIRRNIVDRMKNV